MCERQGTGEGGGGGGGEIRHVSANMRSYRCKLPMIYLILYVLLAIMPL